MHTLCVLIHFWIHVTSFYGQMIRTLLMTNVYWTSLVWMSIYSDATYFWSQSVFLLLICDRRQIANAAYSIFQTSIFFNMYRYRYNRYRFMIKWILDNIHFIINLAGILSVFFIGVKSDHVKLLCIIFNMFVKHYYYGARWHNNIFTVYHRLFCIFLR